MLSELYLATIQNQIGMSMILIFRWFIFLKGWVLEYEGEGEVMLRPGSCVLQPPGIRHREIKHSDDLELIEICSPAEFATKSTDAP